MTSASLAWYYRNRELVAAKARARYLANREAILERSRAWQKANPEKRKAASKRYRDKNPQVYRERHWRRAGINVADAQRALREHDGRCQICRRTEPGGNKGWHVDHDHGTGKVRGILCCRCNLALGWLEKQTLAINAYLKAAT